MHYAEQIAAMLDEMHPHSTTLWRIILVVIAALLILQYLLLNKVHSTVFPAAMLQERPMEYYSHGEVLSIHGTERNMGAILLR
jgi:hypothetical protein